MIPLIGECDPPPWRKCGISSSSTVSKLGLNLDNDGNKFDLPKFWLAERPAYVQMEGNVALGGLFFESGWNGCLVD